MSADVEVRPLTPDDAEAYWHVRLEALETCPRAFGASPERHRERGVEGTAPMIATVEGERFMLGAWNGGALVGTAGLLRGDSPKTRHGGYVYGVYVAPVARGRGVGRSLMRELVRRARAWEGFERIVLDVDADNPAAVRLYEGAGFRSFGLERDAMKVNGEYVHLHRMALDLRP